MKVGTDGVALGAWVPVDGGRRILDIGTGTGLIALMLPDRPQKMLPTPSGPSGSRWWSLLCRRYRPNRLI